MFGEDDDWSDDPDTQTPCKILLSDTQKSGGTSVKPKIVGKKSLLRTLQTLGSVPEWKSDVQQDDSDSGTEAVEPHTKKKKKRNKKRKQADISLDHVDSGLGSSEDKTEVKKLKRKDVKPRSLKNEVFVKSDSKETSETKKEVTDVENTEKLSRKQWKNKMKNKRRCKNKYRVDDSEQNISKSNTADKKDAKDQVKIDCLHKNTEILGTQTQPKERTKVKGHNKSQKRKTIKEEEVKSTTLDSLIDKRLKKLKAADQNIESPRQGLEEAAEILGLGEITEQQEQLKSNKKLNREEKKKQNQRKEKLRKLLKQEAEPPEISPEEDKKEVPAQSQEEASTAPVDRSALLRSRMEQRLEAARFRYINEVLYTSTSGEAKRMFSQDPQAFGVYHRGYTAQVQRWPANPVEAIIAYIHRKPASLVVADFGCGDCKIARSVKNRVHSFDLAPVCDLVTVCDMAHVPLKDSTVNIAVFCLSLMGTNLGDFLAEANRVLVMGGVLKIAEVASRFDNVRSFLNALAALGFKSVSKDTENSHFYSFEFLKIGNARENVKKTGLQLKPCLYKKR